MSDTPWILSPREGITRGDVALRFGQTREVVRALLARELCALPPGAFPDEDDFESVSGDEHLRLRYAGGQLQMIEVLQGTLRYLDVDLHRGATRSGLEQRLAACGFKFGDATWLGEGRECEALGINVATEADVGGDSEEDIDHVVIARDFGARAGAGS